MGLEEAILAAVTLALLGGLHCIGMCGGLAAVAARTTLGRIPYVAGKSVGYAVLGAIAGGAGGLVNMLVPAQRVLAIVAGVVLIVSGVAWLGWTSGGRLGPRIAAALGFERASHALATLAGRLLRSQRRMRAFAFGVANGFFPCGLVYGALALAMATHDLFAGALVMAVFGIATAPALLVAGLVLDHVGPVARRRWHFVGALAMFALGAITIMRATGTMAGAGH